MKQSYYRDLEKSTLFWKTSLCWQVDTISVFFPHTICSIFKTKHSNPHSTLCIIAPHRFVRIIEPNACPGGVWLELEASPITPLPLSVLSGHLLEVIIVKKDTLQVVDAYIDCSVGGVPDPFVVYARFSSHRQGEQSIEGQVVEAECFAAAHGLTIIKVYADRAQTGRNNCFLHQQKTQ